MLRDNHKNQQLCCTSFFFYIRMERAGIQKEGLIDEF